ncbi:hypothetical protein EV127DRAFT_211058 [Xylaria flabelliformis]|nr:hypothetical protein EV127DRAFT_211058 [Xylaria flabelliformis]
MGSSATTAGIQIVLKPSAAVNMATRLPVVRRRVWVNFFSACWVKIALAEAWPRCQQGVHLHTSRTSIGMPGLGESPLMAPRIRDSRLIEFAALCFLKIADGSDVVFLYDRKSRTQHRRHRVHPLFPSFPTILNSLLTLEIPRAASPGLRVVAE